MSKYDAYKKDVFKLHAEGKSNKDIALELGIDNRRVSDLIKKLGLAKNERMFNDKPSESQHEVFISMVIGDGCIFKSERNTNYRMNLAHQVSQKDYFVEKYNQIKEFVGVDYKYVEQYDKRTKKTYAYYKIQTKVNPYFTRLYNEWYRDGKKIITESIFGELTDKVLAYKFFDDGWLSGSGYSIAMNDYDEGSVETFRKALFVNFGIETSLHQKGSVIYIPAKFKLKFRSIVIKHATEDVLYKLGELTGKS